MATNPTPQQALALIEQALQQISKTQIDYVELTTLNLTAPPCEMVKVEKRHVQTASAVLAEGALSHIETLKASLTPQPNTADLPICVSSEAYDRLLVSGNHLADELLSRDIHPTNYSEYRDVLLAHGGSTANLWAAWKGIITIRDKVDLATAAKVTSSADLLTAAPLVSALEALLESPRWLEEATIPKAGIDANPKQVVFNASIAYLKIVNAQQALADAATIAEHSAAIWYVMACVRTYVAVTEWQPKASPSELQFYLNKIISSYNALLPSVHDLAGRGGR